jgi:uncharacterized protein (DUF488 family)
MKVFTIGVYGWNEADFAKAVQDSAPDVFVDVRRRRGLRGATYAWANSSRLQATLASLDVPYAHRPEVAPSEATRRHETHAADAEGIGYRDRTRLSQEYLDAYEQEVLATFNAPDFVASLGDDVASLMLFCVEQAPEACHRSLLAERVAREFGTEPVHLLPPAR